MADSFAVRVIAQPMFDAVADHKKRVDRASMWAIRETGRLVKSTAKRQTPVYRAAGVTKISAIRKTKKAGGDVSYDQVISGLLRSSIASARRLTPQLGGGYSVKVGPRGGRVHLYAAKIEAQAAYMRAGHVAAVGRMGEIHAKAWAKAMSR